MVPVNVPYIDVSELGGAMESLKVGGIVQIAGVGNPRPDLSSYLENGVDECRAEAMVSMTPSQSQGS